MESCRKEKNHQTVAFILRQMLTTSHLLYIINHALHLGSPALITIAFQVGNGKVKAMERHRSAYKESGFQVRLHLLQGC